MEAVMRTIEKQVRCVEGALDAVGWYELLQILADVAERHDQTWLARDLAALAQTVGDDPCA